MLGIIHPRPLRETVMGRDGDDPRINLHDSPPGQVFHPDIERSEIVGKGSLVNLYQDKLIRAAQMKLDLLCFYQQKEHLLPQKNVFEIRE